jgi:hypothetical protein
MLAMAANDNLGSRESESGESDLGFSVAGECEEARFSFGQSREKRLLKEVAMAGGLNSEWALNYFQKDSAGQAETSGDLKEVNFIKGRRPGNRGNFSLNFIKFAAGAGNLPPGIRTPL